MASPVVTVVVPTHRRPDGLARALAGLAVQVGAPPHEVLVVDNAGGAVVPDGVRLVVEPVPGAAAARNRGLAETRTDLLAMLDDDVVPAPGWLAALAAPVLAGRADLTGGRVVLDPDVPRPRWLAPSLEGYLTALDLGPDPRPLAPPESLLTASLLTRTDLLRATGGFDPSLGPRGRRQYVGDDVQVVRDLRAAGARAWWTPGAVVVHELPAARLRRGWLLQRAYLQGRSDWRVDRDELARRRAGGTRVALSWLAGRLPERRGRGAAFAAACDVSRTAGALVEAASWRRSA